MPSRRSASLSSPPKISASPSRPKIADVHRLVRGNNVLIAVIDSEIDAAHPDLEGVVAQHYDAVGAPEKPHSHGTGMAGAIASHQRLLGTAPGARLLAVHAFSTAAASPESTTFNILKGVDWSVRQGARIINMSFAGPKDPSLARALQAAYDKGIVLIAAAGNAGPKSPPLYPGADPNVIAVTATDVDDKLFTGANRGRYISVSAPGVDILVPAPEGDYQITTGTSVAAAEVSGIVALLLERNPKLTPADIRRILTLSAKRLSPGDRDDSFGSGLIDPLQALQLADPRTATTTPPAPRPTTRQR
jgi:subtilisin family serine protease